MVRVAALHFGWSILHFGWGGWGGEGGRRGWRGGHGKGEKWKRRARILVIFDFWNGKKKTLFVVWILQILIAIQILNIKFQLSKLSELDRILGFRSFWEQNWKENRNLVIFNFWNGKKKTLVVVWKPQILVANQFLNIKLQLSKLSESDRILGFRSFFEQNWKGRGSHFSNF